MNERVAAEVVRQWQRAKAQALGGKHDSNKLLDVLDGPMLAQWRARAEDVRSHGFHWMYILKVRCQPVQDAPRVLDLGGLSALLRSTAPQPHCTRCCAHPPLQDLKVERVEAAAGADVAIVEATLTEAAVLHDTARPSAQDAYESTYRARYELSRSKDGVLGWKIFQGQVLN